MRYLFWASVMCISMLNTPIRAAQNAGNDEIAISLVGNAHIDLAYRWRWNETVDRVGPDTFEGVLSMMEKEPQLTFAQSQLALYEQIQKNNPVLFERIKRRIAEGRWSVVGGQWAEPDAILPGGESLIRQFLLGHEYARKHLGVEKIDIAWVPDSFCGQASTLPKIYAGCGIKYYVFGRGAPADKRIFWWESRDGSRLLAYKIPEHYNLKIDEELAAVVGRWCELADYPHAMVLYGEGDHGGGPREPDIEGMKRLQGLEDFPVIKYDTPENYLGGIDRSRESWPVFRGEMGIGTGEGGEVAGSWRGAYTSQARSKKANRDMENLLITAEKFATIGSMLQRKPLFPRVDFREIWKIVLKNQFHDILPGTSIGDVFDDAMADYLYVKDEGERLLSFGLEVIGSRIDTRGEGISLIVYNPLSWPRTDVVTAAVRFVVGPEEIGLVDKNGDSVLFQVDGWAEDGRTAYISFLARDVPGIGYAMYRVLERQSDSPSSDLMFGPDFVVNDFFKIRYDNEGIEGIYDKKGGRELLDDTGNVLQLLEEGRSSSWDLTPTGRKIDLENFSGPEVIEDGPVRIVIAWQDRSEDSFFTRELILKAGVPRLTFRMTVDWHDHDKILKVGFPTAVEDGSGYFEQPYGYIERSVDGTEWPAQNWIDLSGEEYGVALLNNGKYGFDILENTMQMSVVRGARDMDPRMDEGMHSFDYALYPHEGDWRDGDVTQQALELNQPMIAVQEGHHSGDLPDWARKNDFSLPPSHTFFSTNSDHVILSAVKVQQGDWSPQNIVLRLYETEGRSGEVRVTLPTEPKTVVETDFLESPIEPVSPLKVEGNSMVFEIGHDQIRTFLVAF